MARIVICTQGGIDDKQLLRAIRGITGEGVAVIAAALRQGHALFDAELFCHPQDEQFLKVRRLLAALKTSNIEPVVFEAGDPISAELLLNIMQSSEESLAESDRLSELGHEA